MIYKRMTYLLVTTLPSGASPRRGSRLQDEQNQKHISPYHMPH